MAPSLGEIEFSKDPQYTFLEIIVGEQNPPPRQLSRFGLQRRENRLSYLADDSMSNMLGIPNYILLTS